MRGAPHVGFSTTIRKINSWTFLGTSVVSRWATDLGDSFQYKRKPPLCNDTTVLGRDRNEGPLFFVLGGAIQDQIRRTGRPRRACRAGLNFWPRRADASARRV